MTEANADLTLAAQDLLSRSRFGVLSTLSVALPGFPMGSVHAYATTAALEPLLCISSLGEHTQNIAAQPEVSLTVLDLDIPPETQAGARFTYLGRAELIDKAAVREQFLAQVPSAAIYYDFGDFSVYALRFVRGRFIGGFGKIAWIETWPAKSAPLSD